MYIKHKQNIHVLYIGILVGRKVRLTITFEYTHFWVVLYSSKNTGAPCSLKESGMCGAKFGCKYSRLSIHKERAMQHTTITLDSPLNEAICSHADIALFGSTHS